MEEAEKRVLGLFRTRLANEIVVTASFLSAFCEKSVLDEEMTKLVKCEDNYTAKAHKLLELLPKRGPKAFSTLLEILEITNPWMAEKMKAALHDEHSREAKLKASSSGSQAASISGYGSTGTGRGTVDNDLRCSAHSFVKSTLTHLTQTEQQATAKWLGEEMQRERRRQQFRSPHSYRRHPEEFQSCKEVQTDITGMELHELCEDLMIQLHGVEYIHMTKDLSFKLLQKQIMELLQRLQKMDLLFIQCLEKFEDTDRYALSLPELLERSMLRQKELVRALMEDRRRTHLLTEERDTLERHVRRLEDEVDHMLKRQSQSVVHPQQMYLKKRKELYSRYTMTKHSDKTKKPAATPAAATAAAATPAAAAAAALEGGGGAAGSRVHDSALSLSISHPDLGEYRGGEEGGLALSPTSSPKGRVRFASAHGGSRASTSGQGRRRPGTSSSGPKSALKGSAK